MSITRPCSRRSTPAARPLTAQRGTSALERAVDRRDGPNGQVFRELLATGAVISGRRTFELAGRWQGDHHDGVPIFVLTHHVDDGDVPPGSAQFVTDVEECAERARAAADDRAVMVHGAGAAQSLLRAGLLDEMEIHLVPVLLGEGRRLFDSRGPDHIELELVRRLEGRDVTHLRYRVRSQ
jgi:dihydrofolate reductase